MSMLMLSRPLLSVVVRPQFQTSILFVPDLDQIVCEALSGWGVGGGKLHKILGLIGLEFWFPWEHIAPIDL